MPVENQDDENAILFLIEPRPGEYTIAEIALQYNVTVERLLRLRRSTWLSGSLPARKINGKYYADPANEEWQKVLQYEQERMKRER